MQDSPERPGEKRGAEVLHIILEHVQHHTELHEKVYVTMRSKIQYTQNTLWEVSWLLTTNSMSFMMIKLRTARQ